MGREGILSKKGVRVRTLGSCGQIKYETKKLTEIQKRRVPNGNPWRKKGPNSIDAN
jgi:hypothetical protein